jgi:hypothetical protein
VGSKEVHLVSNADCLERPISRYTLSATISLEFGRFGVIESVSFEDEDVVGLDEVWQGGVSENNHYLRLTTGEFGTYTRRLPTHPSSIDAGPNEAMSRQATVTFRRHQDAREACNHMDAVR